MLRFDRLRGNLVHDDPRKLLTQEQRQRLQDAFHQIGNGWDYADAFWEGLCHLPRRPTNEAAAEAAREELFGAALTSLEAAGIGLYEVFPELDPRPATDQQRQALGILLGGEVPALVWLTESKAKYLLILAQEKLTKVNQGA